MSQSAKIITLMISRHGRQEWFYAYDFMPPRLPMDDECFVGYEASARLSGLASRYPELFETKTDGKYRVVRFRFENVDTHLHLLSKELRETAMRELGKMGLLKVDVI